MIYLRIAAMQTERLTIEKTQINRLILKSAILIEKVADKPKKDLSKVEQEPKKKSINEFNQ